MTINLVGTLYHWTVSLTLGSGPVITTNNTEILITTIGQDHCGSRPSLTCHTDITTCCRSNADNNGMGSLGWWTYPDRSVILGNIDSATAGQQFFFLRNEPQIIRLARRDNVNPLTPTGSYCCTVPTTGGDMTLCANLGEWIAQWGCRCDQSFWVHHWKTGAWRLVCDMVSNLISSVHSGVYDPSSSHQWSHLILWPNTGWEHRGHLHLWHWLCSHWRHYQDLWEWWSVEWVSSILSRC